MKTCTLLFLRIPDEIIHWLSSVNMVLEKKPKKYQTNPLLSKKNIVPRQDTVTLIQTSCRQLHVQTLAAKFYDILSMPVFYKQPQTGFV